MKYKISNTNELNSNAATSSNALNTSSA